MVTLYPDVSVGPEMAPWLGGRMRKESSNRRRDRVHDQLAR